MDNLICPDLFVGGFDDAYIGLAYQHRKTVAVYDFDKCLEIVMAQAPDFDEEMAVKWLARNIIDKSLRDQTPVFVQRQTMDESLEALALREMERWTPPTLS